MNDFLTLTTLSSTENAAFERLITSGVARDDEALVNLRESASGIAIGSVPAVKPVSNKLELAEAIDSQLEEILRRNPSLVEDSGLWNALTLHWLEQIWGKGTEHQSEYFIFLKSGRDRYRHRLAGPYFLMKRFGLAAGPRALLSALKPDMHGELLEQLLSRQYVFISDSAWKVAAKLYLEKGELKRGVRGKGPGSVRRFGTVMQQLAVTYNTALIGETTLFELLPNEFDRFRR